MPIIEFRGKKIEVDGEGFLVNPDDWSRELADFFAELDGISLDDDHWWFIDCFREYYKNFIVYPLPMILLTRARLEIGSEKATKEFIQEKFPDGKMMIARYAGLPRLTG